MTFAAIVAILILLVGLLVYLDEKRAQAHRDLYFSSIEADVKKKEGG